MTGVQTCALPILSKPSGFVSFLDRVGEIFQKVIAVAHPVIQAGAPFLNIFAPGIGTALALVDNTVYATEAQFQQSKAPAGSGPQKSAQVIGIVGPAVIALLKAEGVTADLTTVQNMIDASVARLNAIPAQVAALKAA